MNQGFFLDTSEIAKLKRNSSSVQGSLFKGCEMCPLPSKCITPQMKAFGRNETGIFIVGEAPGETEDKEGKPFRGWAGGILRDAFAEFGVDIDACVLSNVIQCRPQNNEFPDDESIIEKCLERLGNQIREANPKLVFACGTHAIKHLLKPPFSITMSKMRGFVIPSRKYNSWVACIAHPSYVGRSEEDVKKQFLRDIKTGLEYLNKPLPSVLDQKGYKIATTEQDVIDFVDKILQSDCPIAFDYETNTLNPFQKDAKILTVSFSNDPAFSCVIPVDYRDFWKEKSRDVVVQQIKRVLESPIEKVIQNADFERLWSKVYFGVEVEGEVWDTMITAHVLDEREEITSLEFQAFQRFGVEFKDIVDRKRLESEPLKRLCEYNALDSRYELAIYQQQKQEVGRERQPAVILFNSASKCLAHMKQRGVKVDVLELSRLGGQIDSELKSMDLEIVSSPISSMFRKTTGRQLNINSGDDVRILLFDVLKCKHPPHTTKAKKISVDSDALQFVIDNTEDEKIKRIVQIISRNRKLQKQKSTYVEGPLSLCDRNGFLHPSFMLHVARTFRSSSEDPNFQNFPKRDPELRKMRRTLIPENDFFIEADFKGCEVSVMAMVSRCRKLIKQLIDDVDIHRYWATHLYEVSESEVQKEHRFNSKNGFVFPLFYGSYFEAIANHLKHPKTKVKKAEDRFWWEYPEIKQYHQSKFDFYDRHGYIQTPLGFRRHAPMTRNMQINSEIQGTAFHLLLAGASMADEVMHDMRLKSSLRVEIHDSVLVDVVYDEAETVVDILQTCLTHEHYDFQKGVPMRIDLEMGPNWYELEKI